MARHPAGTRDGKFWEQALDRAQLGLWDWDLLSGACFYSATWARMLGYSQEELAQASDLWLTLAHPDDREQAVASGDRHLAGATDIIETEMRLRHKDGHWVWVLDRGGVVERDAEGRPTRMVGVQTDISRQKEAEHDLAQVNARFRLALTASGTGIWHHDFETRKSYWDRRTREIYGLGGEDGRVPDGAWETFLHPDDREMAENAHAIPRQPHDVVAVRYRIVRSDGAVRHVESFLQFMPVSDQAGQMIGTVRDVTMEEERQRELAFAARHDGLTGLLNRTAFDALLADSIAKEANLPLSVLYIDLDYFKALNDFAGHAAGDAALRAIAASIRGALPRGAHAARLGGDEFAVLATHCENPDLLAQLILNAIRHTELRQHAGPRKLGASIGAAVVNDPRMAAADALACADDACYAAKASGRNAVSVFAAQDPGFTSGLNAARMASDTMDALGEGRLRLFGQEIHRLGQPWHQTRHVEVLARLVGRDGQMISPIAFIPAAERFGMAPKLDRWIFRTALSRHGAAMRESGLVLAFNLSAQTLSDPGLWDFTDATIAETGAPYASVVFEITETAAVTNFEAAERFVLQARERHCKVSLDDFGAGLSSFDYLRRFPVDSIKINGSFVEHMAENRFDREIVSAINGIAKSLGYSVIAERIEKPDGLALLQEMGVGFGQGYLLHRPEPLEAIVARAGGAQPSDDTLHSVVQPA
ncbi:MAG: EAL domain-containing protein [Methylobacterium mesophilicum]|nr:EAL domain-containing protein [Methylobacterium mesophilicum]